MSGIKKLDRNYYRVRVYGMDRRMDPPRNVEKSRWVHGTFAEAKRQHAELQAQLDAQLQGKGRPMTLSAFAPRWLEARAGDLAPSTQAKYVNDLEKHILPAIGSYLIDQLRPSDVQAMLAADCGAPNSKKNRLTLLRKMSKDAFADGLIDRDFCFGVTVRVPPVYTEAEPNTLSGLMLDQVLGVMPPYWLDVVAMLSYTGLRWGEVSAFHWNEIDLVDNVAVVRYSNWKGRLKQPKTASGFRTVPLVGPLPEMLANRLLRMQAENHPGLKHDLVFPTKAGSLHKGTPLNRVLKNACKRVDVRIRFTPHGLRRTWNNIGRRKNGGVVMRAMLGQTSEAMTDHYSHVPSDERRHAAESIAEEIKSATSQASGVSSGVPVKSGPDDSLNPE